MGQRADGVDDSAPAPETVEQEIGAIRGNLDAVISELDIRWHELTDWRLQLHRHGGKLLLLAGAIVAVATAAVALGARRRRATERPTTKLRRLRLALSRMMEDPDAVAKPTPVVSKKIAAAAGGAVAATLARSLVQRWLKVSRNGYPRVVVGGPSNPASGETGAYRPPPH